MMKGLFFLVFNGIGILLLITVIKRIFFPSKKGRNGEIKVSKILQRLPKDNYLILNDLLFKDENKTAQIDHVVISQYGIFVIETKTYTGWIYGNSNQTYWVQNKWGNKYEFYNPIFQNEGHIRFLLNKFPEIRNLQLFIHPVEVFVNCSKLNLKGEVESVITIDLLKNFILGFDHEFISFEECLKVKELMESNNIKDKKERINHNINVNNTISQYKEKITLRLCPRCGGQLVLKTGKYGNFYGCTNYPRCKFTISNQDKGHSF